VTRLAYAALWFYVFSVPWGGVISLGSGVNLVSKLTGAIAAVLAGLSAMMLGRFRKWHFFQVAALLFVLWVGSTQIIMLGGALKLPNKFWTYVQLLVVLWIVWELAPTQRKVTGLLIAYLLGTYVIAFDTIRLGLTHAGLMRRFAAGGADPNFIAMTLALSLPIAWHLGMHSTRPLRRWICYGYMPVGLLAVGFTGSRGGLVATMVALSIVPLSMTRLTPKKLAMAFTLLGLSVVLAIAFVPDTIVERLASTGSSVENLSLGGRFGVWRAGLQAFVSRPFMGYGTGSFRAAVSVYGVDHVAHNSYLSVLVEQGLVGFFLYCSMLLALFASLQRLRNPERRFALVLFATVMVAMLPLTWEDSKQAWFIFAALAGAAAAPPLLRGEPGRAVPTQEAARRPRTARPAGRAPQPLVPRVRGGPEVLG
jgi:O-antigen ligase